MAATPRQLAAPDDFSAAGFHDQTIRDIVWTSAGGRAARITLSNQFGTRPVTFSQVDVGISAGGPLIVIGTDQRVTFAGRTSVTIAPGAAAVSDPVAMTVPAQTDLAVSLFTSGLTGPATYIATPSRPAMSPGPADYAAASPRPRSPYQPALVLPHRGRRPGQRRDRRHHRRVRGFDHRRLPFCRRGQRPVARRPGPAVSGRPARELHPVVDEGISGNRVLASSEVFGPSAQVRFLRDTAALSGARYVIVLEGINDIQFTATPAAAIIAGYQDLIASAHAAGLKIFGATLTPFQGSVYYSAAGEADREAVNRWIRTSGAFDGVIDFDQAVRDPADPLRLRPGYDSGDHLHPDDAGYQAMAEAITLPW